MKTLILHSVEEGQQYTDCNEWVPKLIQTPGGTIMWLWRENFDKQPKEEQFSPHRVAVKCPSCMSARALYEITAEERVSEDATTQTLRIPDALKD
jgi:hypothetical protein